METMMAAANGTTRIVEIGGIKVEVDMRHAKRVDTYRVGENVKVLEKQYGDTFKVSYGVIVDFGDFQQRPSIEVLLVSGDRWETDPLKFISITADSKDYEIAPMGYIDGLFAKDDILERIDRSIANLEHQLAAAKQRRSIFLERFNKFFEQRVLEG